MAGRDHHAGITAQFPDSIGQTGGGHQHRIHHHLQPARCKHFRRSPGKALGVDPGIVTERHPPGTFFLLNPTGQPLRCPGHRIHIHSVGAGTQYAPQTAGSKLQLTVECILDTPGVSPHCLQFATDFLILRRPCAPALIFLHPFHACCSFPPDGHLSFPELYHVSCHLSLSPIFGLTFHDFLILHF